MNIRLLVFRTVAITLICISPIVVWIGYRYSQQDTKFPPELSRILNNPVSKPDKPLVNIFQVDSVWTDQDGKSINLRDFSGKPVVAAFFYTHCVDVCPVTIMDLKDLEKQFGPDELDLFNFVLFTLTPEMDTPQVIKKYQQAFSIKGNNWNFLTGSEQGLEKIIRFFDIGMKKKGMHIQHRVTFGIVDKSGNIQRQFWGNHPDIEKIASLVKGYL